MEADVTSIEIRILYPCDHLPQELLKQAHGDDTLSLKLG